jgi:rRNA maturation endonuclease Nob1
MKYCPTCKRICEKLGETEVLFCPVCGSTLVLMSDEDMKKLKKTG